MFHTDHILERLLSNSNWLSCHSTNLKYKFSREFNSEWLIMALLSQWKLLTLSIVFVGFFLLTNTEILIAETWWTFLFIVVFFFRRGYNLDIFRFESYISIISFTFYFSVGICHLLNFICSSHCIIYDKFKLLKYHWEFSFKYHGIGNGNRFKSQKFEIFFLEKLLSIFNTIHKML